MAFVYWIRKPEHTNILAEGYIGVTDKTVPERYQGHVYAMESGSTLHVHNAMRKYAEIVVDTLLEGSIEYCYEMESRLRPKPNTGYNLAAGGGIGPMTGRKHAPEVVERLREISKKRMEDPLVRAALSEKVKGFRHTDAAKEKIRQASRGMVHSEESKARMSVAQKERYVPKDAWDTPRADRDMWAKALLIFDFMQTKKRVGWKSTALKFETTKTKVKTICQKIKDGWLPHEDASFLAWLDNYNQKELHESALTT